MKTDLYGVKQRKKLELILLNMFKLEFLLTKKPWWQIKCKIDE